MKASARAKRGSKTGAGTVLGCAPPRTRLRILGESVGKRMKHGFFRNIDF